MAPIATDVAGEQQKKGKEVDEMIEVVRMVRTIKMAIS